MSPLITQAKANGRISKQDALVLAERDLATLGLIAPSDELESQVRVLTRTTMDTFGNITTDEMSYKVIVGRKINGLNVRDSRIVLSYFLDGTLQKLAMRWPTIDEQSFEFPVLTRDGENRLFDRIKSTVDGEMKVKDVSSIKSSLQLEVQDGKLVLVVVLQKLATGETSNPNSEIVLPVQAE